VGAKSSVSDRVVEYLEAKGGTVVDAGGKVVTVIARAIDMDEKSISNALRALDIKGLVTRDAQRGRGTTGVQLVRGGANGQVSKLRRGNRVGDKPKRKAAAVRRKAREGNHPRRRPAARQARARKQGRPVRARSGRVHAASRELPAGPGMEAELQAVNTVIGALGKLSEASRRRVVRLVTEFFEPEL
jgi:hypothetical protein